MSKTDDESTTNHPHQMARKIGKSANVEEQPWYHGFRPRRECENLIHEPGDWLLRATDGADNSIELVVSLMDSKKKILHLTIKHDEELKWHFTATKKKQKKSGRTFQTVVDLINHYRVEGFAKDAHLKRGISRPTWLVKHDSIKYDPKKDLVGSGNFCSVYRGRYEKDKNDVYDVAVKQSQGAEEAATQRKNMLREAELMSYYSHRNVIRLFGVACDHPPVLIVMEYCPGGNLQEHLLKWKEKIEMTERVRYLREAARGMNYLHTRSPPCIHRDLAARNCLIAVDGSVKISDFGLSRLIEAKKDDGGDDFGKAQVPLRWMAPESLRKPPTFSLKSDVWSFGVLIYEVFAMGEKPWPDDEPKKIATKIRHGDMPNLPKLAPEPVVKLVKSIWNVNVEARPTMRAIAVELRTLLKALGPIKTPVILKTKTSESTSHGSLSQLSDEEESHLDKNGRI